MLYLYYEEAFIGDFEFQLKPLAADWNAGKSLGGDFESMGELGQCTLVMVLNLCRNKC